MNDEDTLDRLVEAVQAGARYRVIQVELVRKIGAQELAKGRRFNEAVKATRNKLHQVGGSYQEESIDYDAWLAELAALQPGLQAPDLKEFSRRMMAKHASTSERLPILEAFYAQALASLGSLHSILDLACGLNPLAAPWMPLAAGARYLACDIYSDMVDFLNRYFEHVQIDGKATLCDLTQSLPNETVQVALLLKTLPCLEQLDKSIGARLLEGIRAEYLLVSFPVHSLGGRSKGMLANYQAHFDELVQGKGWGVQRFEFASELAFLVKK